MNFRDWPLNLQAGLIVSLVAMPLALGLAIASGAPPMAGIISSVVGALVLFFLSGSHVTIAGPGNGLVVVSLLAITNLGAGDIYQGYLYMLAAVVFSGLILLLLGLARFGALADFFPSAAIQGLLAAIGLLILARQIHVLLGVNDPKGDTALQLLLEIPESLKSVMEAEVSWEPGAIGLLSLVYLSVIPLVRNSWISRVPPPMVVVVMGFALVVFSEWQARPIAPEMLLQLPSELSEALVFPDFKLLGESSFWSIVLLMTFITALESLLSIKAVDKLDPLHRRSNVNKDLRALGIANIFSGLIGGLNVVMVIARSSVNINSGANQRSSNLFHGLFLVLFILLFQSQLKLIPLSALAAILVYTGYKLSSPLVFKNIAKVGWDQLLIFLITYLGTISLDLITGMFLGILATMVIQAITFRRFTTIFRGLFKPNTLLFKEGEAQYHLSVKDFSNFLNFLRIKNQLDTLPVNSKVVVDFTLSAYVDYSVLEQIHHYRLRFKNGGGHLEIVGLDDLAGASSHHLASRRPRRLGKDLSLTRRQKAFRLFARQYEWQYELKPQFGKFGLEDFQYFNFRPIDRLQNLVIGAVNKRPFWLADIHYHEGDYYATRGLGATMLWFPLEHAAPSFVMARESLLDKVAFLAGFRDVVFELHPDFSHRYKIKGDDEAAIKHFFDRRLINFFEEHQAYHIESNGKALLIFEKERSSTISEMKQMVNFGVELMKLLQILSK